jgi:phosphomannomutase
MIINPSVFKAYDVRGVYPDDLNEDAGEPIGEAFVEFLSQKYRVGGDSLKIAVGYDVRRGSLPLAQTLMRSIAFSGANVADVGLVTTDVIYFATALLGFDGGIMVTASHNPKEYTGIKFVGRGVQCIDAHTGLLDIKKAVFGDKKKIETKIPQGSLVKKDILTEFAKHVLSFIDIQKMRPLRVVVDAGNGSVIKTWPLVARALPIMATPLFFDLDSAFSGRGPNPGSPEAVRALAEIVIAERADIGFAFDGDGDRVFVVDERGNFVDGSHLIAFAAERMLRENPQAIILYNVTGGRIIPETVAKYPRGRAVITPVGHSNIKRMAHEHHADFAGEPQSGHYFFKENFYADSAIIFALKILEIVSSGDASLSALLAPYKKYYWSGEINFKLSTPKDQLRCMEQLKAQYRGAGELIEIDGIRFEFDRWWFGVRPSNTESLLRVNVEADSAPLMEEKKEEVLEVIRQSI